jgi:hypothetical protein
MIDAVSLRMCGKGSPGWQLLPFECLEGGGSLAKAIEDLLFLSVAAFGPKETPVDL